MAKLEFNIPIYTYDIDFNGHVSNIVYIKWMEIGRLKLLEAAGMPVAHITKNGIGPVLVDTEISYHKPLFLSDTVNAELWISELSKASAWLGFRFLNQNNELAASGRQRGLFINYSSGKPHRITVEERQRFEPFLDTHNL
jgi:acyl-CoA thioester hydrolase